MRPEWIGISMSIRATTEVDIGPTGLGVIWMMTGLALVVILLRLYAQLRFTRQFGLSDYLMIVSISILIGFDSLISVQYGYGWGRHQSAIATPELEKFLKFNTISQCFGISGSTFGRLSFLAFMIKLFGSTNKHLRRGLWALFITQCITNGLTIIMIYVACKDVRGLWDFTIKATTTCWPDYVQTYIGYAHTSFNAVTDLILTAVPIAMIWDLQMKLQIKLTVGVLLSMSILAFIGVLMKIVYLKALSDRGDATYNTVHMFIWIVVETSLVEIAASIPLLRPMFKRVLGDSHNKYSGDYEMPSHRTTGHPLSGYHLGSKAGPFSKVSDNPTGALNGGSQEEILGSRVYTKVETEGALGTMVSKSHASDLSDSSDPTNTAQIKVQEEVTVNYRDRSEVILDSDNNVGGKSSWAKTSSIAKTHRPWSPN